MYESDHNSGEYFTIFYFPIITILLILAQLIYPIFEPGSNIGFTAHIGGFIAGFLLIFYLKDKSERYWPESVR